MLKTNGVHSKNAIITSLFFTKHLTMRDLTVHADDLHSTRSFESLSRVAGGILKTFPRYSGIGLYYRGLCLKRLPVVDIAQSTACLEAAIRLAPPIFQARALVVLSSNAMMAGDLQSALALNRDAARTRIDPWATFKAGVQRAILFGEANDHGRAVQTLESLYSLVGPVSRQRPDTYSDWLNSLAVERLATGDYRGAERVSDMAVRSNYLRFYPNWTNTRAQIAEVLDRPAAIEVFVPNQFSSIRHTPISYKRLYYSKGRRYDLYCLLEAKLSLLDGLSRSRAQKIDALLDPSQKTHGIQKAISVPGVFTRNKAANLRKILAILLRVRSHATEEALTGSLRLLGLEDGDIAHL